MAYLAFGCHCLLVVVFACSAVAKFAGRGSFAAFRLATARLVPALRDMATPLAVAVVSAELTATVLLAVPAAAPAGLVLGLALLAAFTVAVAAALRRGETASCNCFGRSTVPLQPRHLVRNALLMAVAVVGLVAGLAGPAGAEVTGMALAGAAAVVLAVLVLNLDALADLFTPVPERTTP
ncbi:MauE/DoxX family redox-associated membrane protein [Actinophytocola sp.]|uniref:MauE/DoxX family redox-associated membrane protein n=1 Tax=Actinophytocola sp. TaxID=1872138 RepID=UPI002ED49AA3